MTRPNLTGALALLATSMTSALGAHEGGPSRFNFHDHVRPLLVERCGGCHRLEGAAPMTLLDYDEIVPWSRSMMIQVLEGTMPPWLPAEGIGDFENSRLLSASEIDMLIDWSVGELPEGQEILDYGIGVESHAGWSDGEPDLVFHSEAPVTLGVDEEEKDVCLALTLSSPVDEALLVSAFELDPGLRAAAQRATLYVDDACTPGSRPLLTWLPDQGRTATGGGLAERLPKGSRLSLRIFYRRGWDDEGVALEARPRVGVWLATGAETLALESMRIEGTEQILTAGVELLAIYPDPDTTEASPFRIDVQPPGGELRPLLVIDRYNPQWREKYRLREPLPLTEGTVLSLSRPAAWFDFKPRALPAAP